MGLDKLKNHAIIYSVTTNPEPKRHSQLINGVRYIYYDYPYWDKEKKQNRHKRDYVGKIGPDNEFIPNAKWYSLNTRHSSTRARDRTAPARRQYCGATHLLDEVCIATGLADDLRACFPENYKAILSLAYYLALESDSPMYRFCRWSRDHRHPYGREVPSQRISDLVLQTPEHAKLEFFRRRADRIIDGEYLAYDTTSVSSYSEAIKAARYGKNKDGDPLPQVNIALLIGERSSLPVYYRILPGNIADVSTVRKLVKDVAFIQSDALRLVMDRGFFSAANIHELYKTRQKFILGGVSSSQLVRYHLEAARQSHKQFRNFDDEHGVYFFTYSATWPFGSPNTGSQGRAQTAKKIYVHVYYDGVRAEDEKLKFTRSVRRAAASLAAGDKLSRRQQSIRDKFITLGPANELNDKAIQEHLDRLGYFALLSNDVKSASDALEVYRRKDIVEKAFDNCKERLELRRTAVHSDAALEGTVFVQFVALIMICWLQQRMRASRLFQNYTMQSLFDTLDVIEMYEYEGQGPHLGEITEKQAKLYASLGVPVPNTL